MGVNSQRRHWHLTQRPRNHTTQPSGFTLVEVLIAMVVGMVLTLAGVSLLLSLLGGAGDVFQRVVGQSDPQEVIDVLDPLLHRAGNALPSDSAFGGLSVSSQGDTVIALQAHAVDEIPFAAAPCAAVIGDPTPTPQCAHVRAPAAAFAALEANDHFLVVTSPAGRSALVQMTTRSTPAAGVEEVQWTSPGGLGLPAANAAGATGGTVQRIAYTRLWYDAGSRRILVDDPVARQLGRAPWVLATDILLFVAEPLYNGRPSGAPIGGLRPGTGTNPPFNAVTGLRIRMTQRYGVLGGSATQTRTYLLAPPALGR